MVSSTLGKKLSGGAPRSSKHSEKKPASQNKSSKKKAPEQEGERPFSTICLTLYVFRGQPIDFHYKRHVLAYFTSPEVPGFHETVHIQRETDEHQWVVDRIHNDIQWEMSATCNGHVNAGSFRVPRGEEMIPVDIMAATPISDQSDWNCQHFILNGISLLVERGYGDQEWYNWVENELFEKILDNSIG